MHTSHHSFLFTIPTDFFNASVKVITPYEVNVRYSLDFMGRVELEAYYVKPGMAKRIVGWDELEKQMLAAAEHNSKGKVKPGAHKGRKMRPEGLDPYQDIHDQWKAENAEFLKH